jgi:hypothetical protein
MSTGKSELNSTVAFSRSKADIALLKAVKKQLSENPEQSFSDLCKDALRYFLVATENPATLTLILDLQQQITELQVHLEAVQETVADHREQLLQHQDQGIADLGDRLERVERHLFPEQFERPESPPPAREPDPLIERMTKLIEDF